MSEGNNQIKEELFSLFKGIKDDIPNDKLPLNRKNIQNISTLDSITLITYIKESIPILINQKISEAKTQNNNDISVEFEEYSNLKKEYYQLENQLKKVESDNRYYLQKYLKSEIQKKVLDMKLNAYMCLEEEYEELKEKVKYEGGKFLDNERKDNEIFILRAENSALKKEILKFEHNIKTKENRIKEHQQTIKELKFNIENLNHKIFNLKKFVNNNNNINNSISNKTLLKEKNNSMLDLGIKNKNNENYFMRLDNLKKIQANNNNNNINDIQEIKSLYPQTYKIRKKINFNPPRNDSINKNTSNSNISINTTNRQLLATIYSKLNKHNKRNTKIPFITLMKMKGSNYKSLSVNKEGIRTKDEIYNKSNNKRKIFKNILYSKPQSFSPKSC